MSRPRNNRFIFFVFTLIILGIVGGIVALKITSRKPLTPEERRVADSLSAPMAVPDTTIAPDVMPAVIDTVAAAVTDSLGRDPRPADEAGAEDGYWDGYYDGVAGREEGGHDVSSRFPTRAEREAYATNYAEGYRRGYAEGLAGKDAAGTPQS